MVFNYIFIILFLLLSFGAIYYYLFIIIEKRNTIKEMELKNEQYDLFMKMDPKLADEEIDKLIDKYIDEYTINIILMSNIDYMKSEDIDKMIKTLTRDITLKLSELYIFYIKILVNISSDDDLLRYIHKRVKNKVLLFVTEYNKPRE
jgi:hypothetical protein